MMFTWSFILFTAWTAVNSLDQCTSNYSDFGPVLIKQLYGEIKQAECELASNVNFHNYEPQNEETFDFVIIGGGTAGSVLANRLSENSKWKILILEAGGDPTVTTEVPGFSPFSLGTELDWIFKTEPGENVLLGFDNKTNIWSRGKVLGGSSVLNSMVYIRGNPKDYDNWASLGNAGWSYSDLLPLFKKLEDMRDPEILSSPNFEKYHGRGGLLTIEPFYYVDKTGLTSALKKSMKELGYEFYADVNADKQKGLFRIQGSIKNGKRCSAAKAFLLPAQNRPNLNISKYSQATKIIFKKNRAQGVQFIDKQGRSKYIKIRKDVVVSAGSINTPKILMLSGIGPRKHLQSMKIKNVHDLPVGQNLQDHLLFPGIVVTHNISKAPSSSLTDQLHELLTKSTGPLSGTNVPYTAFIDTSAKDYPDIQIYIISTGQNETALVRAVYGGMGLSEQSMKMFEEINLKYGFIAFLLNVLRPKGRGKILLKSPDPKIYPKIYAEFLKEEKDWEVLLKGIEFISNLTETNVMKSIDAKLQQIPLKECKGFPSREYWKCSFRYFAMGGYHQCGTCKMGPASDLGSVVDARLRVYGVKNLRVADLSIAPQIVSSNTQAAAYVIGEKAAQMIKEDYIYEK